MDEKNPIGTPSHKSMLIMVFGLPGTGKTTFARALSDHMQVLHLNTDILRAQMGKRQQYNVESKALIYGEMQNRAKLELEYGKSVILDGTFYKESYRKQYKELAQNHGAAIKWIQICADEQVVKKRVAQSRPFSEADYEVYQLIKREFEPLTDEHLQLFSDMDDIETMITKAVQFINE